MWLLSCNWKPYEQYYSINEHKIGKGAFGVVFKAHSIKGKAQKSKNFKLFGQSANFPVIFFGKYGMKVIFEFWQDKNEVVAIKKVNKEKVKLPTGQKMQIDFLMG